ncbi:MAG: hypothetical protein M0P70_17670 [Desulfobulbaceae bacterium]|nr:hypothetical protein [Desulfobulbaceae bacterium]
MTIISTIDHDQGYMVAIAAGSIGWEEVRTHLLAERLAGGLSYRELIDARTATPTWSSAQAREIVSMLTNFGRKSVLGPTAVVVSSEFGFGMIRMLEILLEDVCIVKPFQDYAAAEQWLRDLRETAT